MQLILNFTDRALAHRRDVRLWCSLNGLLVAELVGSLYVSTESARIIATTTVPADGHETDDFPEMATDLEGHLITTQRTVDLVTDVPPWLAALSGNRRTDEAAAA